MPHRRGPVVETVTPMRRVRYEVEDQARSRVASPVFDRVENRVWSRVEDEARWRVFDRVAGPIRDQVWNEAKNHA